MMRRLSSFPVNSGEISGEFRAQGDNTPTLSRTNRDMLLMDKKPISNESSGVLDLLSSASCIAIFHADNNV